MDTAAECRVGGSTQDTLVAAAVESVVADTSVVAATAAADGN
jgi:hypothetical protein